MLTKIKKLNGEGFTIIEVMIVLAIAGLILLIVFLAVPALQRNARNTQRKNDVSNVLAGINTATSNNNGVLPGSANGAGTIDWLTAAKGTTLAETKVGYYTTATVLAKPAEGDVYFDTADIGAAVGALDGKTDNDWMQVIEGDTCNGAAAAIGSSRQVAVLYEVETTGGAGYAAECQSS